MIDQWWMVGIYFIVALLSWIPKWVKNATFIVGTGLLGSVVLLLGGFYNAIYEEFLFTRFAGLFVYGAGGYLFSVYFEWALHERKYWVQKEKYRKEIKHLDILQEKQVKKLLWDSRN